MSIMKSTVSADTISVIVPVYGVEPYLPSCIESILGQTHRDFQLILVDDGSPDRCGEICDEYAAKDSRIVVIHQENAGVSAARNAGLDWVFANSDSGWLNFVDSDDMVSPVYLETLYRYALENDADITITSGYRFVHDSELVHAPDDVKWMKNITGVQCCRDYLRGEGVSLSVITGRLVRRKLYEGVRFPVGMIHEDEAVAPVLMYRAKRVTILCSLLYRYRKREGSILRSPLSSKRFDIVPILTGHIDYFRTKNEPEFVRLAVAYRDRRWIDMVQLAKKENRRDQIPAEFRLSPWKVGFMILRDTMYRGGVKLVLKRLGNLFEKIIGNR